MTASPEFPRGWYQVDGDPGRQREWDGARWTGTTRPARRPFAAGRAHPRSGIALLAVGALVTLSSISGFASPKPEAGASSLVVGLGLLALGVFLFRGRGNPRQVAAATSAFQGRIQGLRAAQDAGDKGAALISWRAAVPQANIAFGPDGPARLGSELQAIGFDPASVSTTSIGTLTTTTSQVLEVYNDYVICGEQAFDTVPSSKLEVFVEGQKQLTVANVQKKGKTTAVLQEHDLRTAGVMYSSVLGSLQVAINPDLGSEARRIASQYNSYVETLKPRAASASEIAAMLKAILAAGGQTAAERLQDLNKLRFERLLSDEQFEAAKARILGLPQGA